MRWQHRLMVGLAVVLTGAAMATTGKLANGTGNLSKARREALIGKIEAIKQFLQDSQDPNAEQLLAYTRELSQEVRAKKFGLVFEEHRERVDVVLEENLPIVREEAARFLDHGGELNFLIEGENLAALKLLAKTHRGKVDVIYIDPPYNTGNKDFVYNDCYVDANDLFRHSKWLSFMEKRLKIARELLADTGVIFISIDDNEQAELKVLCDNLFGENNFVATMPRVTKRSGKDHSSVVGLNHDYLLVYAKNSVCLSFAREATNADDYTEKDEYFSERGPYKLNQTLDYDSLWYNPAMDFELKIGDESFFPGGSKAESIKRHEGLHAPKDWVWRWSKEKFEFGLKNGFVVVKDGKSRRRLYTKTYLNAQIARKGRSYFIEKIKREQIVSSLLFVDNIYSNDNAKKELGKYLDKNAFDFPKPSSLIEKVIQLSGVSDALVLDFFAGSGTTGHAVMKLNAADGGKRRFILVTNNENGICERVTYERLRRVMEKEGYAARLKYLKVDYVPIKERLYYEYANELLGAIRELVELENGIDFAREQGVAIVQTDEELAALVADEARLAACRKLYKGHEVLMGNKQKAALRRAGIEVLEIPQYYYPELED